MSSKRAFLKQAKEALASKDYHAALTHCKAVLQEDKACYDAYVLIGKAAFFLKEYTQAEAAYKRASDLDAANLMAWQGFAELYSETGQWAAAASAYANLVQLTSASPDEAIRARAQQFLRKQSESAFRAGSYSEAEDCYRRLLVDAPDGPSRLELLCLLADVQLGFDRLEVERRLAARMAEATIAGEAVSEAVLRQAVEAEWAEEGLEMEMDHASATLREILAEAPPSPRYAPYYEAYLRRLRKYLNSAPAGSMERHNRRIALVQFSKFMMEGRVGDQIGGCCSSLPYEAALSMLEVEGEVAAPPQTAQQAQGLGPEDDTAAASSPTSPEPLVFADSECICKRLARAFPWSPAAGVHLALAMRRRWLHGRPSQEPCTGAPAGATVAVTVLSALLGKQQRLSAHRAAATQRKFVLRELLAGLKRGVNSAAGWLAAADLLLEHHQELQRQQLMDGASASAAHAAAQGALDAAKEGLKFVAHRDFLGKEHMEQAGLLLRLTAARALLALGVHAEAEGILSSLAERCSEGRAAFALLAGMPPVNVSQQAVRSLAQSALAQGDRSAARRLYESLVGRLALGRDSCGATAEPWAHAEYGWLMMEEGDLGVAQQQLETAVHLAEQQQQHKAGGAHPMTDAAELGTMRVKLARVYWALGGELRAARGSGAHAALLAAAAADGPHQAAAFSWLGRWYHEVAADEPRARKCYQRALALDPAASEHAGRGLVALLVAGGQDTVATELCAETVAACPAAHWALRSLARLQLAAAQAKGQAQGHAAAHAQAAVLTYQRAVRASPAVGELWEGLAAAYQALGRHTAALKAFTRALELEPARLFSLLQCGAIHHQLGSLTQAADCFRRALELSPGHPAALLGSAEARLASAQLHWRMGAGGVAAMELHAAALSAAECGARHGNMAAAWKLAGDALLQHAGVSPLEQVRRVGAAKPGEPAAAAAAEAVTARAAAVRAARTAYCKALHLDPTQGLVWGDAAVAAYQEASLTSLASSSSSPPISSSSSASPRPRLLALAQRLVQGGLKLEPSSEWLWACAGSVAEGSAASREYCWTRALQVNPKRAATWAALGRLYALKGAGALAQQCFEHARSHEPTLVSVWEAMASLAATRSKVPGDPAYADMMDAYEHAVGLGGGLESRLAFAADSIKSGAGPTGEVFAASTKCVQQLPTLAAAHNSLGLAAEARGHLAEAVAAFETALALMPAAAAATPSEGNSDDAAFQLVYLGVGPCGADLGLQAATGPRSLHMALRLNLCRTLAKVAGSGDERATDAARAAVALYRELVAEGAMQSDALAWVSYASALERAGGSDVPAQVASALEAAVAVASSSGDGGDGGKAPAVAAMVAARRLVCALALCKHLVQQGKWQEAHRLVQEQTAKSAMDADCAALAAQLWLALWAAVTAANTAATSTAAPAIPAPPPGLKLSIPAQLQAWALSQKAIDMAKVSAHVCSIDATGAAASGNLAAATHAAARAVRCCPWDPRFRLQLASCASSASPEKAMAASRAAPLAPARLVAPAMDCLAVVPASEPAPMSGAMSAAPSAPRSPVAPAPVAAAAVAPPTNPSLAHCDLGGAHVLRASGLLSTLPLPQLQHALASEVSRLTHLVHAQPDSTVAWYLLALVSLQHAAAVRGAQCRLYRQTLARCRVALGKVQALHAQLKPPPAPAAAGAAGPVGGLAAMINAAAAAAAAKQREKAALPSKEKALQYLAASLALRLLAASSECHLHVRLPGCQQRAKDTAAEALRWALQHELSPALAHRQLGRVQRALGELEAAQVALNQAAMAKDVPALLEYSSLLSSCGKEREALQLLASAQGLGGLPDGHPASCMASAAALEPVKLRVELGDLAGARQELGERVRQDNGQQQDGMVPAGAMAAALALQARVALGQAQAEATSVQQGQQQGVGQAAGDAAVKRLVLEARWAAGAALKELQGQPGSLGGGGEEALARLLLGQAELARSRPDKAIDELEQAIALWARPAPAALVAQHQFVKAGQSGGPAQVPRACLAGAVHAQPWSAESWQRLLAA